MATASPPTIGRERKKPGPIIPVGFTLSLIFMGADIVPLSLRPLDHLGIPYPHILRYTHVIAPIAALVLWIVFRRSTLAAIVAFLFAILGITSVAQWADSRPIKIPVTHWIDSHEWQKKLGFNIWEQGDAHGTAVWVDRTPGRANLVREEAKKMGVGN
jgi:hypothetical protein